MAQVATIQIPSLGFPISRLGGSQRRPYTEHIIGRSTQWLFAPGRTIYELVSPDKDVYVMQSYAHLVDATLTEDALAGLGARLSLPTDWQYRPHPVTTELVVGTPGGEAHVIQDDFQNTYLRLDD